MVLSIHSSHVFRGRDASGWGKGLFVFGAGLLAFSSVCLMRRGEAYLEIQGTVLTLFALAAGMVLSGEAVRIVSHLKQKHWDGLERGRRMPKGQKTVFAISLEIQCAFCGKKTLSTAEYGAFTRCLGCGKTVCARCADLKGKEMGRDSSRCPGCGGQVY